MKCQFRDGDGIIHDIIIQSQRTVKDLKKTIEDVMMKFEYQKMNIHSNNANGDTLPLNSENKMTGENENNRDSTKTFESYSKTPADNENESTKKKSNDKHILNKSDFNGSTLLNENISLSLFKYRWDLFTIKHKVYTLYNDESLSELDIKEGDIFIITPIQTVRIFFMLPINSKNYFDRIFKPQFLYNNDAKTSTEYSKFELDGTDNNNAEKEDNTNINDNDDNNTSNKNDDGENKNKNEKDIYKVNFKWNDKVGWLIGPIAIPFYTNCTITLLNALETVFGAKQTNIKIFDSTWNEIRMLAAITPIDKNNLVFGLYIRNPIEEQKNFPNKNFIAWTNVFKYKYYNLPTRTKSRQVLQSKSNSKLQVLIAQPIPQEDPKIKNTKKKTTEEKGNINSSSDAIPLGRAKSGPIKESQIPLNKASSIIFSQNNDDYSLSNRNLVNLIDSNTELSHFYHPIPVFFSYDKDKKVLAFFNSDEIISTQMMEIKKDLGIPEAAKIHIEYNGKAIDTKQNPENLKIIEFSTLKITLPGSCLLI